MIWGIHGVGGGWCLWGVWGQEVLEGVWGVKVSVQKIWDVGGARILGVQGGVGGDHGCVQGSTHAGQAVGKKMGDWVQGFGGSGHRGVGLGGGGTMASGPQSGESDSLCHGQNPPGSRCESASCTRTRHCGRFTPTSPWR